MEKRQAANILYKATHDQPVPFEALLHATKWYCEEYKSKDVNQMKVWSESAAMPMSIPYRHVDFTG